MSCMYIIIGCQLRWTFLSGSLPLLYYFKVITTLYLLLANKISDLIWSLTFRQTSRAIAFTSSVVGCKLCCLQDGTCPHRERQTDRGWDTPWGGLLVEGTRRKQTTFAMARESWQNVSSSSYVSHIPAQSSCTSYTVINRHWPFTATQYQHNVYATHRLVSREDTVMTSVLCWRPTLTASYALVADVGRSVRPSVVRPVLWRSPAITFINKFRQSYCIHNTCGVTR